MCACGYTTDFMLNRSVLHLCAEAEAITISNRYLAIATSGGLNQQRTGVTFFTFRSCTCQFLQYSNDVIEEIKGVVVSFV